MSVRRASIVACVLAVVAGPATVAAQDGRRVALTVEESRHLWATVNVCDTASAPDTVGVRGSMPGSGDVREELLMRFEVQYLAPDGRWQSIREGGDSGFVLVGKARRKPRQAGRSFRIGVKTGALTVRGKITFEWRLRGEVVRRVVKRTRKGHRSSAGADPEGYSAATCTITPGP